MPNAVEELDGEGGLRKVRLARAGGASCEVYIYAAHVTSWKTANGMERLFLSSKAEFAKGKAIRGGIPICWPQFAGRGPYAKHGFARNTDSWKVRRTVAEPSPSVTLELRDCEASKDYPFSFVLTYTVTLESDTALSVGMQVVNQSDDALDFTAALHTYFAVSDVGTVRIRGLKGLKYEDNAAGGEVCEEAEEQVAIQGEVDRVYLGAPEKVVIVDGDHSLSVEKRGLPDAVVWNIGDAKAGTLKDLGPGEWQRYVCVEAAAIGGKVTVAPGAKWEARQVFGTTLSAHLAEDADEAAGDDAEGGLSGDRLKEIEGEFKAKLKDKATLPMEKAYKLMFTEEEKGVYSWKDFLGDMDDFKKSTPLTAEEQLTWEEAKGFLEAYG